MALNLNITNVTQANDATVLRVTDSTGLYNVTSNPGGWLDESAAPIAGQPKVSAINGTTISINLQVKVTTSNGSEIVYDILDLFNVFGPFTSITDLVFDLTPDMLISSGTAMGTSDSQFVDGWYDITYNFVGVTAGYPNSTFNVKLMVDGKVRQKVYDKLRDIPYSNEWELFNHDYKEWYDILYPMYYNGLLTGMLAEISEARKDEILEMLSTLERLLNQKTS